MDSRAPTACCTDEDFNIVLANVWIETFQLVTKKWQSIILYYVLNSCDCVLESHTLLIYRLTNLTTKEFALTQQNLLATWTKRSPSPFIAMELCYQTVAFVIRQCPCSSIENCALLAYYAASSRNLLSTFRENLSWLPGFLTVEDWTDCLSRNVGKELPPLAA